MPVRRGKGARSAPGGGSSKQVPTPAAGDTSAPVPAPKPLSPREERFVELLLKDPNQTKAAEGAGYSAKTAASQASRMLKKVNVAARLEQLRAERSARTLSDADKIIRELERIAESDLIDVWEEGTIAGQLRLKPLSQWPTEARRAIAGMKVKHYEAKTTADGVVLEEPYDVMEIKFWNKIEALRMLGTHHGLRFSRTELTGKDGEPITPAPTMPQVFMIGGQRVEFK